MSHFRCLVLKNPQYNRTKVPKFITFTMADSSGFMLQGELPKALACAAGAAGLVYFKSSIPFIGGFSDMVLAGVGVAVGSLAYNYSQTMSFMLPTDIPTMASVGGAIAGSMAMPGPVGIAGGAAVGELAGAYFTQ